MPLLISRGNVPFPRPATENANKLQRLVVSTDLPQSVLRRAVVALYLIEKIRCFHDPIGALKFYDDVLIARGGVMDVEARLLLFRSQGRIHNTQSVVYSALHLRGVGRTLPRRIQEPQVLVEMLL